MKKAREPLYRGNVAVMSITTAINVIAQMIWYPLLPFYFRELQATDYQVSLAYGLGIVATAILQVPGGLLSDKFGRKAPIVIPNFIIAGCMVAAGVAPTWVLLTVALFLFYAAGAIQQPCFVPLMAESVPAEKLAEAYAVQELSAFAGLGLGPVLGAALLPYLPKWGLFALSGALYLAGATIRALFLREGRREAEPAAPAAGSASTPAAGSASTPAAGSASTPAAGSASTPATSATPGVALATGSARASLAGQLLDSFRPLLSGRLAWVTLAAMTMSVAMNVGPYGPFLPLFAHDRLGFSKGQVDMLYSVGPIFAAVTGMLAGRLADRRGGGYALALGFAGGGTAFLAMLVASSYAGALGLMCAAGLFMQFLYVGYDTLRAESITGSSRGRTLGALGTVAGLAGAVAVPLVGKLTSGLGLSVAFWVTGAVSLAGMAASLRAGMRPAPGSGAPGSGAPAAPGDRPAGAEPSRRVPAELE